MSVPVASAPPCPFTRSMPVGSVRERFSRYTPVKVTRKPHISDSVLTGSVVLNPLKRIEEAQRVAVVKVT